MPKFSWVFIATIPTPFGSFPSHGFQPTNWQIPTWNTSFLLSLGNKDLAKYELHRTTSCIQMAVQTVRKWASSALSSAEGCFAHCSNQNSGECISYQVRGGRGWTQLKKGSTTDPFLLPTIFSRNDESRGKTGFILLSKC